MITPVFLGKITPRKAQYEKIVQELLVIGVIHFSTSVMNIIYNNKYKYIIIVNE